MNVVERVEAVRRMMRERALSIPPDANRLRSLFLIGSCSSPEIPPDWYQDYDVHFLFDDIAITPATVEWLRTLLADCRGLGDSTCRITTSVKDRPCPWTD